MVIKGVKHTAAQIAKWCNGAFLAIGFGEEAIIRELIIDTRKIAQSQAALFIALRSLRRDGHGFIANAYEKGIRNFLVSEPIDTTLYPLANFIKVPDTLAALQSIAASYRKCFDIPVIGITGSNGKTIVKEWLYQLLSNEYKVVRSPKSYNSQIGVPLSVWLLEPDHTIGIFEAGISQPGEMANLERILQPSIGIFTNIGEAHSEGFLNNRQKIKEKLLLFRHAKNLIYCKDYPELNECIVEYIRNLKEAGTERQLKLFTWSHRSDADLRITSVIKEHSSTSITGIYQGEEKHITIPFTDPASVENAIHCWCVLLLQQVPDATIVAGMAQLQPVSMRLELKHGINGCTVINDSYNSDVTSLYIALDYLEQQKQHKLHTVVLSDMLQIAKPDRELYEEVADIIGRMHVQRFIGIGPALYRHKATFRKYKKLRSIFFKSTDEFLKKIHLLTFENEAILLKGARSFTFEKVGFILEQKIHQTILSINLSSVTHNLNVFRSRIRPGTKIMVMVKAFSYGSGSYEIANLLQYSGVDYLAVAYTDEGIALRKAGITMPIMVMSPDVMSFDRMIAWKLEPEIYNLRSLKAFTNTARTLDAKSYPVHIKLDTGMHRLGFSPDELEMLINDLSGNTYIRIASIFSHLAASEDPAEDAFTQQQANAFRQMSDRILAAIPGKPILHLCNSAAIARHDDLHFDMVRLGLGLYGIDGSKELQQELVQVGTLKTTIAQIKNIEAGDAVGYGRRGKVNDPARIATISIGYADGYPRTLGNGKAYVLIHNKPAAIIGSVCMDMCMVDVTGIPEATEGDDVIVFGPQLTVVQLAAWAGTIPYEIMTGISQRVKRVYVNEV